MALESDFSTFSRIDLAVSRTSNPEDGWYFYIFDSVVKIGGFDSFADYPGLGVDKEAIYITNNMFGPSFKGVRLWIVPKASFYSGMGGTSNVYDPSNGLGFNFFTAQPAHVFGDGPIGVGIYLTEFVQNMIGVNDYIRTVKVIDPLGSPSFEIDSIDLGEIAAPGFDNQFLPQKGSTFTIRANDSRALNAVWRNGQLATCFKIKGDGFGADLINQATAHWVLLNDNNGGSPTLLDQGNILGEDIAPSTSTFYPAVALNKDNSLAIGFSATGPNIYPGAYYTGRLASDPAGTVDTSKVLREGVTSYSSFAERWGDYTSISVDPEDDYCFWVYNEYANTPI